MHCCYYIAFAKIINSEPKKSVTHGRTDTYAPFAGLENIAPLKKKMAHPYTAQDKHCLLWYRTALHTIRGYNRIGQQRTLHFNQCKKINHKPFSSVFNVKPTLLNSRAFFRAYTQKPSVCCHSKRSSSAQTVTVSQLCSSRMGCQPADGLANITVRASHASPTSLSDQVGV